MTTTVTPFDRLAADLTGTLHLPGAPGYDAIALPWNVAITSRPVAIVEAASAQDVATAVRFAAGAGLQVSVQATGHGAVELDTPFLQISTRSLRELHIGPTGAARVGAGLTWQDVIAAAAPLGFAGLCGSAPHVGVVGFLTGGGIGPLARTYGVSADYVTAFDVVTADGELRRATATENTALFWGLRGGKGALGVVTAVEFDLVPLTAILGGCLYFAGDDAATVLHTWREWTATLPEQATSSVAIVRLPPMPGVPEPLAGQVTVALRFAWVGDAEEGERVVAPMREAGRVVFGGVGVMPYTAVGMIHNDPVDPLPATETSTVLRSLPAAAVDALVELAGPQAECPQIIVELRHLGGALSRAQGGPCAYSFRDAPYVLEAIGIAAPPVVAATEAHGRALLDALAPYSDGSCLPNFQASADPREIARKYDAATLTRLATLVRSYDPNGVLTAGAAVTAAAGAAD